MKTLTRHLVALSLLGAGSASAADLRMPVKAPPPAPPAPTYSWTGCYIDGGGGYGLFDQDSTAVDSFSGVAFGATNSNGGRGWFGTVGGGCDYQLYSNFVIGAFGDFDFSDDIRGDMSVASLGLVGREKLKDSWHVGGRLGWLPFSQQFLAYVSGGYTEAKFNQVNFNDAFFGLPTGLSLDRHTYTGWFIGAGYEYALGWFPIQGVFWKTEYRFADYGRDQVPIVFTGTNIPLGIDVDSRKFVQTIRSELVWRFNFGSPVVARY